MTKMSTLLLLIVAASGPRLYADNPRWTYDGGFHEKIVTADRLVVRPRTFRPDEEFNQSFIDEHSKPIFVVEDADELRAVAEHLKFKSPQQVEHYFFRGHPILEWYRGEERLATAALKIHCLSVTDFGGDVQLTTESAEWVADWLAGHGFKWTRKHLDRFLHREEVAAQAEPVLAAHTPTALPAARAQAEAEVDDDDERCSISEWFDRQDAAFDRRLRAAYADQGALYHELFRLVGCLPMVWDAPYSGAQRDAFEFLGRTPREELDRAFQAVLRSNDPTAINGAVWVLFVEVDVADDEDYGEEGERELQGTKVTEHDLTRWFAMFADVAYASSFPQNRRVVLSRLVKFPRAVDLPLLRAALADPDQTVRQRAIEVLWKRGGESELALLREMAAGKIKPRSEAAPRLNYAEGLNGKWGGRDYAAGKYDNTDQEAAEGGIFRIELEQRRRRDEAAAGSEP